MDAPAPPAPALARTTMDDVLAAARARIRRWTPAEAWAAVAAGGALLVDTRDADRVRRDGAVPGALQLPLSVLPWRADPASPWRDERLTGPDGASLATPLVLICADGWSSSLAAALLHHLGWADPGDVDGGFAAWAAAGLPVEPGPGAPVSSCA